MNCNSWASGAVYNWTSILSSAYEVSYCFWAVIEALTWKSKVTMQLSRTDIACPCPMRHLQSQLQTLTYISPPSDGANTKAKLFIHTQLIHNSLVASQKILFLLHKVQVVQLTCIRNPCWRGSSWWAWIILYLGLWRAKLCSGNIWLRLLLGTLESFIKETLVGNSSTNYRTKGKKKFLSSNSQFMFCLHMKVFIGVSC